MTETVLMGNLAIRSYMLRKEKSNGDMIIMLERNCYGMVKI